MEFYEELPISIIVPAYNVEEWLDECLQSIVMQSFGIFEILLINDGSTDSTGLKCKIWEEKDPRITFFDRPHGGLSAARNFGIDHARGEYLLFVDSDDWVDRQYVEKLYKKAIESQADIIECDFWRFNNDTGTKTYRPSYGRMGVLYTKNERLLYGESVAWKCMFKKSIWKENNVRFPDCLGASHVTYVVFLLLGMSFEHVKEPLYYYRRMRKGSIINGNVEAQEEGKFGTEEINALISELKDRGLYEGNEPLLQRAVKYRLSDLLAAQFGRKDDDRFKAQRDGYYSYFKMIFPAYNNEKYCVIGGYNLNRILSYIDCMQDPYCRFNFSSIISISHPVTSTIDISHMNVYRKKMIERDVYSLFWDIVKEIKPDFIFIDLIDDRFPVIEVNDGFVTYSDAFEEMGNSIIHKHLIDTDSDAYFEMWTESVCLLLEKLTEFVKKKRIVIVENYLSDRHGNIHGVTVFDSIDYIRKSNLLLKRKYDYIKNKYKDISWVEAFPSELYFTDDEYEYGAVPEHLNEIVNKHIAKKIEGCIFQN